MSFTRLAVLVLCLTGVVSCDREPPAPAAERGGITEYTALLANMEAVRRDVHELSTAVAMLRQEVARLDTVAPSAPAPAAAPAPVAEPALVVDTMALDTDDPVLGSDEAGIAIVEFSDYECPFCARFNRGTLPELVRDYIDTGKVRLITRDLPLAFHPNAVDAALAVNCAGEQGAYEAVRAGVFDNQQTLGDALYRRLAEENGLDVAALETCMQDGARLVEIEKDAADAAALGITGTPSFLIGRLEGDRLVDIDTLVGARPYAAFAELIDAKL